jgi:hypothetical protein
VEAGASRFSPEGGATFAPAGAANGAAGGEVSRMKTSGAGEKPRGRGSKPQTKDPRGGLTAAGREEFRRKEGAHLKPGVKRPRGEMSVEEMRRKGSWAVRFYGRSGSLPPLRDKHGKPTRFALTAAAWGEAVPKTVAAARKIAKKGHRLLAEARRKKEPR